MTTTIKYYNEQGCNYRDDDFDDELTQNEQFTYIAEELQTTTKLLRVDTDYRIVALTQDAMDVLDGAHNINKSQLHISKKGRNLNITAIDCIPPDVFYKFFEHVEQATGVRNLNAEDIYADYPCYVTNIEGLRYVWSYWGCTSGDVPDNPLKQAYNCIIAQLKSIISSDCLDSVRWLGQQDGIQNIAYNLLCSEKYNEFVNCYFTYEPSKNYVYFCSKNKIESEE